MPDNSSLKFKVWQRQEILRQLRAENRMPLVLECFAGFGIVFGRAYRDLDGAPLEIAGAALEKNKEKVRHVARQRKDWIVARGDNATLIANGFCKWLPFNVLDADAYGSPWEVVLAFLDSERERGDPFYIAATDGLGYALRVTGWVNVLQPLVEKYGEKSVRAHYLGMIEELLELECGKRGFVLREFHLHDGGRLSHWTAKIGSVTR
jgi:tRNA G26 N,N-dimethylase Trm1